MDLVRIGHIGRAHGLRGEVGLDGCSLTGDELARIGTFVWRGRAGAERPVTLVEARPVHARLLVRFAGCEDRDQATAFAGGELWAEAGRIPDPGPGVAYTFQLIGMSVVTEDGRTLGTLADIFPTGAHAVYVVRGEKELLLPATPEVLRRVDMAARVITVAPPAGIEDL